MSILTTTEVASFLGISPTTDALAEAIDMAEDLVAGKLGLPTLELGTHTEERIMGYTAQQVIPKYGPVRTVTNFVYGEDDVTADVEPSGGGWSIIWSGPFMIDFDRVKSFARMARVEYTYTAGWTNAAGAHPLPSQVKQYVLALSGLMLGNLLASGVYDTKLGDMTIKIQRETLEKNLEIYDKALRIHSRPC